MISVLEFRVDLRRYGRDDYDFTMTCLAVDDRIYLRALDVHRFVGRKEKYRYPESCKKTRLGDLLARGVVDSCPLLRAGLSDVVLYDVSDAVGFVLGKDESKGKVLRDVFVGDLPLVYASEERKALLLPSVTAMVDLMDGNSPIKAVYGPLSEIVRCLREFRGRVVDRMRQSFERSYDRLVRRVLKDPVLELHLKLQERNEPDVAHLVSFDWRRRLDRLPVAHSFRTVSETESSAKQKIVGGPTVSLASFYCVLRETDGLCISAGPSEPLVQIARDLTFDLKGDCRLETSFEFAAEEKSFKGAWLYDGKRILARFRNAVREAFGNETFPAVASVRFDSRELLRGDGSDAGVVRIGGTLEKLLVLGRSSEKKRKFETDSAGCSKKRKTDSSFAEKRKVEADSAASSEKKRKFETDLEFAGTSKKRKLRESFANKRKAETTSNSAGCSKKQKLEKV